MADAMTNQTDPGEARSRYRRFIVRINGPDRADVDYRIELLHKTLHYKEIDVAESGNSIKIVLHQPKTLSAIRKYIGEFVNEIEPTVDRKRRQPGNAPSNVGDAAPIARPRTAARPSTGILHSKIAHDQPQHAGEPTSVGDDAAKEPERETRPTETPAAPATAGFAVPAGPDPFGVPLASSHSDDIIPPSLRSTDSMNAEALRDSKLQIPPAPIINDNHPVGSSDLRIFLRTIATFDVFSDPDGTIDWKTTFLVNSQRDAANKDNFHVPTHLLMHWLRDNNTIDAILHARRYGEYADIQTIIVQHHHVANLVALNLCRTFRNLRDTHDILGLQDIVMPKFQRQWNNQ